MAVWWELQTLGGCTQSSLRQLKMIHKSYTLFLAFAAIITLQSCARQYVEIGRSPATAYHDIVIDARNKMIAFSAGVIVDIDLWFRYGGPKIDTVVLRNSHNDILWQIVKKSNASGSALVIYGEPDEDYQQIVPSSPELLPELYPGYGYTLEMVFEGKRVVKRFIYSQSLLYLDDDL